MYFSDIVNDISLGVQASNIAEVSQFSSTIDNVYIRLFTNNNSLNDNLSTGVIIGSSNYDKSSSSLNDMYLGMITGTSNIQRTITLRQDRVGFNTNVPSAQVHIYSSNVYSAYNDIFRIDIASNQSPVFVVNKNGYIGMGTNAIDGTTLTIKGILHVDSLQIGGGGSTTDSNGSNTSGGSGTGSLITAQGMTPVSGNILQFNNSSFCNISSIYLQQSLYASNTVYTNTISPIYGSTIYNSGANLTGINVVYPYQLQFTNSGTASTPSMTFLNNNNSGIFQPATNTLAFSTAGNESVRINSSGYVGINTTNPIANLHVKGTIIADNIIGSNILDILNNISSSVYINSVNVIVGSANTSGSVPFTVNFKGNSPIYNYTLTFKLVSNGSTVNTITRSCSGNTDIFSMNFNTGIYSIDINAYTSGSGTGSTFISNNLTTFTVGLIDNIGIPTVSLVSTPTFSTGSLIYVSSIPYYSNGTFMILPISSLQFTNIYNIVDPRTVLPYILTINGVNYTYAQVFNNVLVSNSQNDFSLNLTINISGNSSPINLLATVYNINYQSGNSISIFSGSGLTYLDSSFNENTLNMATFTGLSISSAYRLTISRGTISPNISSEVSSFSGSVSAYDAFYSPYTATMYNILANVPLGTYSPTMPSLTGSHNYLTFMLVATAKLGSFVLNLGAASGINYVYVNWQSLNSWYNATVMYNAGGCAASSYVGGTRYPITLPQGTSLSGATNIYINIQFNGSIPIPVTVSNT